MYPRIPWELVADPLGSAEHRLRTTDLDECKHFIHVMMAYGSWLFAIQSHTLRSQSLTMAWQMALILRWLQHTHTSVYKRDPFELSTDVFRYLHPNSGDGNIAIFCERHICNFWLRKISERFNSFRSADSSNWRSALYLALKLQVNKLDSAPC